MLTDAAVIVPVYRDKNGELKLVLIRRSEFGVHSGQLAFPGGRYEQSDKSMLHTALRETEEEIGLKKENIFVLSPLPLIETLATGYRIHPFLARIIPPDNWIIQETEVAEVLEMSIANLANPQYHAEEMMKLENWPSGLNIPFFKVGPYKLWGASYRIILPLIPRLADGEFEI